MHTESKVRPGMTLDDLIAAVGPAPCAVLATDTLRRDVDDRMQRRKSGGAPRPSGREKAQSGVVAEPRVSATR